MSTQAFNRHTITSAYGGGTTNEMPPSVSQEQRQTTETRQAQNQRVLSCLASLRNSAADERLEHIKTLNQEMTDAHLEKIVDATGRWLDNEARERMRAAARKCAQTSRDPTEVMLDWLTDEEFNRLVKQLETVESPESALEVCYAVCEAEDIARAAYFIQQGRLRPQVDPTQISQSPQEVNDDLDFVNAR